MAAALAVVVAFWGQDGHTTPVTPITETTAVTSTSVVDATSQKNDSRPKSARSKFLTVPVAGQSVAVVVDADSAMWERLDGVAILTEAFAIQMQAKGRSVGVALATEDDPAVVETQPTLELTTAAMRSTIYGRFARGETDLVAAASVGSAWRPDELFLVFGRRLDPGLIEAIAQKIQQSGAVTHVVALGAARDQDLSALLAGVQGEIHKLSDDQLLSLARLTRAATLNDGLPRK